MVEWKVHSERRVYDSEWVGLALTTVEPPGVEPFEHHVVRATGPAAGCIITRTAIDGDERDGDGDGETEVLLLYRHRFITDTWGWEIPAGRVDPGEDPAASAAREALEETGWEVGSTPTPVTVFHPSNGVGDQTLHIFHAPTHATWATRPTPPKPAGSNGVHSPMSVP